MSTAPDPQGAPPADPGSEGRKREILEAAYAQFARYGFRRTSMEDLARAAGLSRASLYVHFRNKDEIFRTLAEHLHEQAWEGIREALARDGGLEARLREAFVAWARPFQAIAAGSEHAAELYEEGGRLGAELGAALQKRFHRALSGALREADRDGAIDLRRAQLTPASASELLRFAAYGLKRDADTARVFQRRIAQNLRVFVLAVERRGST